jgi:hypothetical protein
MYLQNDPVPKVSGVFHESPTKGSENIDDMGNRGRVISASAFWLKNHSKEEPDLNEYKKVQVYNFNFDTLLFRSPQIYPFITFKCSFRKETRDTVFPVLREMKKIEGSCLGQWLLGLEEYRMSVQNIRPIVIDKSSVSAWKLSRLHCPG